MTPDQLHMSSRGVFVFGGYLHRAITMLLGQSEGNIQHVTRHRDNVISGRLNHNTRQMKNDTETA